MSCDHDTVYNFVWLPLQPFKSRISISCGLFVTTTRRNMLMANHYESQCWLIVFLILRNKFQCDLNTTITIPSSKWNCKCRQQNGSYFVAVLNIEPSVSSSYILLSGVLFASILRIHVARMILWMRTATERRRYMYIVTSSLIGWKHTVYPKKYAHGFCFAVIHWLIFPYPPGLLHWHCGNLTIAPVPAKQPWWIWINTSCEFIMNDCITTTKQSTTKPCAYFLGYTVHTVMPACHGNACFCLLQVLCVQSDYICIVIWYSPNI